MFVVPETLNMVKKRFYIFILVCSFELQECLICHRKYVPVNQSAKLACQTFFFAFVAQCL